MCIWRPNREFFTKQITPPQHGKCLPTTQAIEMDMCGMPLLCDFVAPPTRVGRVYLPIPVIWGVAIFSDLASRTLVDMKGAEV